MSTCVACWKLMLAPASSASHARLELLGSVFGHCRGSVACRHRYRCADCGATWSLDLSLDDLPRSWLCLARGTLPAPEPAQEWAWVVR